MGGLLQRAAYIARVNVGAERRQRNDVDDIGARVLDLGEHIGDERSRKTHGHVNGNSQDMREPLRQRAFRQL